MKPTRYRRKGIASLPVSIFFIALVATAFVGVDALTSGQSGLASKQLSAENTLAARQQELSGLSASPSAGGTIQLAQSSGAGTSIVYALLQESDGQTLSEPVSYAVSPGQATAINITSLAESVSGGILPSLTSVTLVTSRGLYITSQVQTVQRTEQVTKDTTQTVTTYQVSETSSPYYSCPSGWTLSGSGCYQQQTTHTWAPGYYTSQQVSNYVPGHWQTYQYWVSRYSTYQQVSYYVPGHWQTSQTWVPGYYTSYTYTYTTYQRVQTGGYWTIRFVSMNWGTQYDYVRVPVLTWVPTYSSTVVVHHMTGYVWHPGQWITHQYWASGYWATEIVQVQHPGYWATGRNWVSGYQTTSTVQVWNPGHWQTNIKTVRESATYFGPETTSLGSMGYCPSGGQYSCAPYTVTKTVPVTSTITYETISTQGSTWLVGG